MPAVEERVDRLEDSIDRFITSVGIEFNKLYNSQMRTEAELRSLQAEMAEFKEEMRVFKDGMSDFKDEMRGFKDEMSDFKNESRQQIRQMNRQWGELANKLGSMVEDLVYPSLPRIVEELVGLETDSVHARWKQRLPDGRRREFDAVALAGDLAFLNSTMATLRSTDVDAFVHEIDEFRLFLPQYADRPLIGLLAKLSVDESVLRYAEKTGFIVLATGDRVMEIKNSPGFEPKRW
jgi:Sec-independent protein translocase protein TatA